MNEIHIGISTFVIDKDYANLPCDVDVAIASDDLLKLVNQTTTSSQSQSTN